MRKVWMFAIIILTAVGGYFLLPKQPTKPKVQSMLKITSSAFSAGGMIPKKYTCDGENISPQLPPS